MTKSNLVFWTRLTASLVFFIALKTVISFTTLSSFNTIIIDAEFSQEDVVDVFYSSGRVFKESNSVRSQTFKAGERMAQRLYLNNNTARFLRIDPGLRKGIVKLYGLRLASFYGASLSFDPKQIYETFTPNANISTYALHDDYVLIDANSDDPSLVSKDALQVENLFLAYVFPALVSLMFWWFLATFDWKSFPAFIDLEKKKSSTGAHIHSLDGVRGVAALMVLAEHSGIINGIGAIGVWLFFGLSGFLLATPFVHAPSKAFSLPYMQFFLLRRLKRIIPMYYAFILVTMLFNIKNPDIFRHVLFLQGDGHLWTIPQEMFFYLLLPFTMMLCGIPGKRQKITAILIISVLIILANNLLTKNIISLYGNGHELTPMAGIFFCGVLFSYLYSFLQEKGCLQEEYLRRYKHICSLLGSVLLIVLVVLCTKASEQFTGIIVEENYALIGFLTASVIFWVVLSGNSLLGNFMGFLPLRAVGIVGFSFYLLHPVIMDFVRALSGYYISYNINGMELFVIAGVGSYLLSIFTYTYIERPFLHMRKREGRDSKDGVAQ